MSEQPPTNDDSCEELLQAWGTHTPGDMPNDLKGRVLQRMTARPAALYRTTFAIAASLLICFCLSVLWWGRENPPEVKLAVDPPSPPASHADILQQVAAIESQFRRAELESRIATQQASLLELQRALANQRLEFDRASLRKQVVSEWLANNHQH